MFQAFAALRLCEKQKLNGVLSYDSKKKKLIVAVELTEERLKEMKLNDRPIKAIEDVKKKGRITNKEYQNLNNIS